MDALKILRVGTFLVVAAVAVACTDPSAGAQGSGGPPAASDPATSADPAESGAPAGPDDYEY